MVQSGLISPGLPLYTESITIEYICQHQHLHSYSAPVELNEFSLHEVPDADQLLHDEFVAYSLESNNAMSYFNVNSQMPLVQQSVRRHPNRSNGGGSGGGGVAAAVGAAAVAVASVASAVAVLLELVEVSVAAVAEV